MISIKRVIILFERVVIMKTIYIYPKLAMGFRGFATGLDREGFFLKKRSTRLKKYRKFFERK
ncbi:hypothetical protein [Lysinibacillus sp. NPDC093688]|uniref:hypothetical protein n=1 Tax=Lysinibacillus sp. NPDC093688 TaxID=3390577 RepID=UPI003CFE3F50